MWGDLRRGAPSAAVDPRVWRAVQRIIERAGRVDITAHLTSRPAPRNLTCLFHTWAGTSPKLLCRMVRFRHVLGHFATGPPPTGPPSPPRSATPTNPPLIRDFNDLAQLSP